MGNFVNDSNIKITAQCPEHQFFNFHKDYKERIESQSLVYPSFISKNDHAIHYARRSSYNQRQYEISYKQGQTQSTLYFSKIDLQAQRIWKNLAPNETIQLNEGNVIRLGDIQFEIKKICRNFSDLEEWQQNLNTVSDVDPRQSINMNLINSRRLQQSRMLMLSRNFPERSMGKNQSKSSFGLDLESGQFCRYCYGIDSTSSNPLLSICRCSGSVKFSHYYCLKNWITSRSTTRAADCYEYFEYDLSCEVCKTKIDKSVVHKGKKYVIYSDSLIHPPFVVMTYANDGTNKVKEFIINFDYSQSINIGKGVNCDMKLNQRLISNEHCQLIFTNNTLLLQNRNPAYGTFVRIEKEWKFSGVETQLQLMIGNTLIQIKDQSSSCFWNRPLNLKINESE